jgi:hypothetical protein
MNEQRPHIGLEEINEKLDRLLSYQRASMAWGIFKGIIWLVFFILLVVIPTYLIYQFAQNPWEYIDVSQFPELKQMFEEAMKQGR